MKTIIITNDQQIARDAQAAGVTRIMVDLESHGKKERQASRNTFISSHCVEDIAKIRAVLTSSQLIVRINPWNEHSAVELDQALTAGADIVMLPMITQMEQLDAFLRHLAGRAQPLPLLETAYSMEHVQSMAANPVISELYIGLNDLHLSLGLDFLFEPLANGVIERMAEQIKAQGKPFGFGGIAALGGAGELPPESILAEHVRLGSSCVILSSRFCKDIAMDETNGRSERIAIAVQALQNASKDLAKRSVQQQLLDAKNTQTKINALAQAARKRNLSA